MRVRSVTAKTRGRDESRAIVATVDRAAWSLWRVSSRVYSSVSATSPAQGREVVQDGPSVTFESTSRDGKPVGRRAMQCGSARYGRRCLGKILLHRCQPARVGLELAHHGSVLPALFALGSTSLSSVRGLGASSVKVLCRGSSSLASRPWCEHF